MAKLPAQYEWLAKEPGPKMIVEALKEYGTLEVPGIGDSPIIIGWASEIGAQMAKLYKADSVPWCGLFMAVIAKRAGKVMPKDPLWALNWGTFGEHVDTPGLGDVLVFVRHTPDGKKAGHVGLYVGEDDKHYYVLGGNQKDAVNIMRLEKTRLYAARRPDYKVQPSNIRVIKLTAAGELSTNEA